MSGYYTWSKSIDDAASVGGNGHNVPQNSFDLEAERALSNFNVGQKLVVNHTYELPFGEQRRFLNRGGPVARIIGNWQISGVTTLQTGIPLTAQVAGNQSNNNGSGVFASERPDATGLPISLPRSERTTLEFFNTAAFSLPASGELGTAGRNTITGPGSVTFNMSLGRFFTFSREKGHTRAVQHQRQQHFQPPELRRRGDHDQRAEFRLGDECGGHALFERGVAVQLLGRWAGRQMGRSADRQIGRSAGRQIGRSEEVYALAPLGERVSVSDGRVRGSVPHDVMWPPAGSRNKATMITGRSNTQTASKANATAHLPICRSADLPICPSALPPAHLPICPPFSGHLPICLPAHCPSPPAEAFHSHFSKPATGLHPALADQ